MLCHSKNGNTLHFAKASLEESYKHASQETVCFSPLCDISQYEVVHNSKPENKTSGSTAALHGCALKSRMTIKH